MRLIHVRHRTNEEIVLQLNELKRLVESEIDSLKLTSSNSSSKLKALELQKQSFIPQTSSQEANSRLFLCFHLKTFVRPP